MPELTPNKGTPLRVMFGDLPTLKSSASINKRNILLEMANIDCGDPRSIRMGNFMVCT